IKYCRTCYDHLAGKVGVLITEALLVQKIIELKKDTYIVTKKGELFFSALEIDIDELKNLRRIFARPCLDWSERKHHLAGSLGAAILNKMISLHYMRKTENSRAIVITTKGKLYLYENLKISI